MNNHPDLALGCRLPDEQWIHLNLKAAFEDPSLRRYIAPFPPAELMSNVSGLADERDFAAHGCHFYQALTRAAGRKLCEFPSLLDFGCGVGRLMRLLKGFPGALHGCDIDPRHVAWMSANIDYCRTVQSRVTPPLPYEARSFDAIISISVFSHLEERSQFAFLEELARVARPGATLLLTIHGDRAMRRARTEKAIFDMIAVPADRFEETATRYDQGGYGFILQQGHLTRKGEGQGSASILEDEYEYGITFIPKAYVEREWSRWFEVRQIVDGGLHDFQDIVVLRAR